MQYRFITMLISIRCIFVALLFLCCSTIAWVNPAESQSTQPVDWVFFEARLLPKSCAKPVECIPKSSLILRNLAFVDPKDTREITLFLNRLATIRGISDEAVDALNYSKPLLVNRFHAERAPEKTALLRHHPGVYFDSTALDANPETRALSDYLRTRLTAAGMRFLSKEEMEQTPGRPKLSLRYARHRESEGCIIPFSLSLTISEEVVLIRDPELKSTTTIWSGTIRENLANRNYRPASGIRELVDKFLVDWLEAQA